MSFLRVLAPSIILILSIACQRKSEITPFTEVKTFSQIISESNPKSNEIIEFHDDGSITVKPRIVFSEDSMNAFEEDIIDTGDYFGNLVVESLKELFFNMAVTLGFGKTHIQARVKLPEFDFKELRTLKIAKAFIVMDNRTCLHKKMMMQNCSESKFYVQPKKTAEGISVTNKNNFKFLDKILINFASNDEEIKSEDGIDLDVHAMTQTEFKRIFIDEEKPEHSVNIAEFYAEDAKENKDLVDHTFYFHVRKPSGLKKYIMNSVDLKDKIDFMVVSPGILIVKTLGPMKKVYKALKKDEIARKVYGVSAIRNCRNMRCVELEMTGEDLMPILRSGETGVLNVYLDLFKVPRKAFWLKGYIQFNANFKL